MYYDLASMRANLHQKRAPRLCSYISVRAHMCILFVYVFACVQIASNKRYAGNKGWTVSECAERVEKEMGKVDIVVRALRLEGGSACGGLGWGDGGGGGVSGGWNGVGWGVGGGGGWNGLGWG